VPPTRNGFGTRLMTRGLARELDGEVTLSFPETGARCDIDVPLTSKAQAA
jgi:two-component sensor histidine kinase